MAKNSQFNIYIGKTAYVPHSDRTPTIPAKWKPILALAYAYTTNSINNAFLDLANIQSIVQLHEEEIDELQNQVAGLASLNNEDFINAINEIASKIDQIDPDILLGLAYEYTELQDEIVLSYSYSYSYSLYETGIIYSYDYTDTAKNELQQNIDSLSNKIINEYVTYSYAEATYAHKTDIPSKLSDLENDGVFITHAALDDYVTSTDVDSRIENLIGAAPTALDTLEEIAQALGNNENLACYLTSEIDKRATISYVQSEFEKMKAQKNDIPIYDESKRQELINVGQLPDKYIEIPSGDNLPTPIADTDTYLSIIFKTLRALQEEVSRIQRTFDKGIISMVNEQTRMSEIASEYADVPDEEPVWSISPDTLTEITGAEFYTDNSHSLEPAENVLVDGEKLVISGTAAWRDNNTDIISGEETNYLKDNLDAKQYVYITSSYPNIKIYLASYVNENNVIVIDLNNFNIPRNVTNKYNVLLCLSRAVKSDFTAETKPFKGDNFAFLSVADYFEARTIIDGYFKNNILHPTEAAGRFNMPGSDLSITRYYISRIEFTDLELYKMKFYSKFQDFSSDVQPIVPDDDDTYSVAHITIRSVKNLEQLKKIKEQLLENELIYNDANNCIYIIKNNEIKLISGGSNVDPSDDTSGMERNEIIKWLESNGIIGLTSTDDELFDKLSFNAVGDITFINQLNEKYKFTIDTDGKLRGDKVNNDTFADLIAAETGLEVNQFENVSNFKNTRGFIGTYNEFRLKYKNGSTVTNYDKDMKLNSDRLKIGNIYAPWKDQNTFGCTHGYIELENSSDRDYPLDGFYLHFVRRNAYPTDVDEWSLPLSGVIPAGGTYLIRCKQYSTIDQSNTFIDVDSFDIEWIIPESVDNNGEIVAAHPFDIRLGIENTFLLTYGCPGKDRVAQFEKDGEIITNPFDYHQPMYKVDTETLVGFTVYHPCYVDSVSILAHINPSDDATKSSFSWCGWSGSSITVGESTKKWAESKGIYKNAKKLDALYKTTFELDPAKQAYQGLHWDNTKGSGKDSSRVRSNTATDYQTVFLQKEYIEFPKSDERLPVSVYKPMASYLHKNVCTDKTKLDMNKPNSVTVSFGIDMFKTRCFNWVSAGEFDEYVWVRQQGTTEWKRFESYKERSLTTVVDSDPVQYEDATYNKYLSTLATATRPLRKEFTYITNNAVYARIKKTFPGTAYKKELQTKYTAHKCIIEITNTPDNISSPQTWEYVVGRADKNMNPDTEHSSEIMNFTMYPKTYIPRLYQTTDQQGFHWIEYQTWAAAAKKLNEIITIQQQSENIIPVVLNTGDATQNGTRVNEWLDYYIGGKCLFNHLEQMSIVGNNDLCDIDPEKLGTGDDSGKSNGFYHHVFYCYELDETMNNGNKPAAIIQDNTNVVFDGTGYKYLPIIKGNDNVIRYIPSFYWFGTDKYTFMMMNSELTATTCKSWYKKTLMSGTTEETVNIYTGWSIKPSGKTDVEIYDGTFTSIYTMLYNIITDHINNKKTQEPTYNSSTQKISKVENLIIACHEMPFTVVTAANLKESAKDADRSINNGTSLVGSHMNKMNADDAKANYWFSRLLEHFNVKFVYGGHKHTYAITNELRENYLYTENGETKYSINKKMEMGPTLENDTAVFTAILHSNNSTGDAIGSNLNFDYNEGNTATIALSKFPLMNVADDIAVPTKTVPVIDPITQEQAVDEVTGEPITRIEPCLGINHNNAKTVIYPYYGVKLNDNEELGGVIYMMCQATGFKLKSNKELPGPDQRFSYIIPKTTEKTPPATDGPSDQQLVPMYTEIHPDTRQAYLARMVFIHAGDPNKKTPPVLSQTDYATEPIRLDYLYRDNSDTSTTLAEKMYGKWSETKNVLLTW